MWDGPDFTGAKIALLSEGSLIAYKRDMKPGIPFAGMWDLPGGGREGGESPVECAIRETREEFGLSIDIKSIAALSGSYPAISGQLFSCCECRSRQFPRRRIR
jgi:8-oxo-dGTP pyrophosphatase MutT (NUDIX family)